MPEVTSESPVGSPKNIDVKVSNPHIATGAYRVGLQDAVNCLAPFLNEKDLNDILYQKLEVGKTDASEAHYIQSAVELTVCSHFARFFPALFRYEPKLNPPKDVDCAFSLDGCKFNVEVRCADYTQQHEIEDSDAFKIDSVGRLADFGDLVEQLSGLFGSGKEPKKLLCHKKMDNKLKDYLISAHGKFLSGPVDNELNVLVVCCDDAMDMQKWYGYMYAAQGLFTEDSYVSHDLYSNVDVVLLSNLYHRHRRPAEKPLLQNHWSFSDAFNVICVNPGRSLDRKLLDCFASTFPHFTNELIQHFSTQSDYPDFMKQVFLIPDFVATNLYKNEVYHFQPGVPVVDDDE